MKRIPITSLVRCCRPPALTESGRKGGRSQRPPLRERRPRRPRRAPIIAEDGVGAAASGETAPGGAARQHRDLVGPGGLDHQTPGGATIAIDPWLDNPKAPKMRAAEDAGRHPGHARPPDHVGNAVELAKKTGAKVIRTYELASLLGARERRGDEDRRHGYRQGRHDSSGRGGALRRLRWARASRKYAGPPWASSSRSQGAGHLSRRRHRRVRRHVADRRALQADGGDAPIGGHFTMDPVGAALATKMLKVKTVIPMHFGTFPILTGTPDELRAALKKQKVSAKVVEF